MAARKQLWHPDVTKKKIQTSQLINRLQNFALLDLSSEDAAKHTMSSAQVQAAFGLINKVIPNVQPIDPATGSSSVTINLNDIVRKL